MLEGGLTIVDEACRAGTDAPLDTATPVAVDLLVLDAFFAKPLKVGIEEGSTETAPGLAIPEVVPLAVSVFPEVLEAVLIFHFLCRFILCSGSTIEHCQRLLCGNTDW